MKKAGLGIGATCSILANKLHPSSIIRDKYPNLVNNLRLNGFKAVRQEIRKLNRRDQLCVIYTHEEEFLRHEFHSPTIWWTVTAAAAEEFNVPANHNGATSRHEQERDGEEGTIEIPNMLRNVNLRSDDPAVIAAALDANFMLVDDDNDPLPENVPIAVGDTETAPAVEYVESWDHDGVCFATASGGRTRQPCLNNHNKEHKLTRLQLFEILFPIKFIKETIIKKLDEQLADGNRVSYGEFLQFIEIWY